MYLIYDYIYVCLSLSYIFIYIYITTNTTPLHKVRVYDSDLGLIGLEKD